MTESKWLPLVVAATATIVGAFLVLAGLSALAGPAYAAVPAELATTLTVCRAGPPTCGYATIQEAVDAAGEGDIIKVAAGVYSDIHGFRLYPPDVYTQVVFITKSIILRGGYTTTNGFAEPPDPVGNPVTLNPEGQGRGLCVIGEVDVTIEGLHIAGGYSNDDGGGALVIGNVALVRNNWILNNTASRGGGLFLQTVTATVSQNVIQNNGGGGLGVYSGQATLIGNTITQNSAGGGAGADIGGDSALLERNVITGNYGFEGGGLLISWGTATLLSNTVAYNGANNGGGIKVDGADAVTLTGNTILGNGATFFGGGICAKGAVVVLHRNVISGNGAGFELGGGLYLEAEGTLDGDIIYANGADGGGGGGLALSRGNVSLTNVIIAGNRAGLLGGNELLVAGATLQMRHGTIAGDPLDRESGICVTHQWQDKRASEPAVPDWVATGPEQEFFSDVAMTDTIIVGHQVGITVSLGSTARLEGTLWGSGSWANQADWGGAGSLTTGTLNLWGDPAFIDPSGGDYHLGADSAAVDAGVDSRVPDDVDGDARPAAFGFDIGADERAGSGLRLRETAQPVVLDPGQLVTYSLAITGVGIGPSTGVRFTDTLPTLQQGIAVTASRGSCTSNPGWGGEMSCSLGDLALGDAVYVTWTAQVTTTLPPLAQTPWWMHDIARVTTGEAGSTSSTRTLLHYCRARLDNDPAEYPTIQAAVDASTQPTDVVRACGYCTGVEYRGGTTQTLYLSKTLVLQGGWDPSFTQRDADLYPTTLDARGRGRVLYITGPVSPVVEGLRITGGDASRMTIDPWLWDGPGGGIFITMSAPIVLDCQIFGNWAYYGGGAYLNNSNARLIGNDISANSSGGIFLANSGAYLERNSVWANLDGGASIEGGSPTLVGNRVWENREGGVGLYQSSAVLRGNSILSNTAEFASGLGLFYSSARVDSNIIAGNSSASDGGGVYMVWSADTLSRNKIAANSAPWNGGGLFVAESTGIINGNTITANTGDYGGGIALFADISSTINNNLILENSARQAGSGIYIYDSSARLLHNTIVHNVGGDGSGICVGDPWNSGSATLINTILLSHTIGIAVSRVSTATLEATLWGNQVDWTGDGTIVTGTHNYWGDPAFVHPIAGNYHIGPGSAALDRGIEAGVGTDLDGQFRPCGLPDLGSDEYWPIQIYLPLIGRGL